MSNQMFCREGMLADYVLEITVHAETQRTLRHVELITDIRFELCTIRKVLIWLYVDKIERL
jgi:hypothetical protein